MCAIDGADGLERFQRGAFDVVVTDEIMPRMSGLALGRACKMLAPHVPVLLVTGSDVMPTAHELDSCGIRQVLAKPFTPETLLQAVDRAERG